MRYTVLLSRDKATLLTDKQTGRKRHNPNKPCGLARRGWLAPAATRCFLSSAHYKGRFGAVDKVSHQPSRYAIMRKTTWGDGMQLAMHVVTIEDLMPQEHFLRKPSFRKVFRRLFEEVVGQCIEKGLVSGRVVGADSTHVRANASRASE